MKILIIGAYPYSIISFRGKLIQQLITGGHEVTVMSAQAPGEIIKKVEALGATFRSYDVERNGLNPFADLKTLWQLTRAISQLKPDKILAYTIKPIIWGGIATKFFYKGKFYALITGLGYAFETKKGLRNFVNKVVRSLYKFALKGSSAVIFQNNDNKDIFIEQKIITRRQAHRIYGSGVDVKEYSIKSLPDSPPTFLLIARLLGDKGIREYVNAARFVKSEYPKVNFNLLGPVDTSPDRINLTEVNDWEEEGVINYLGETDNVLPYLSQCHVYTLPSYHEGLPRTVLEAMAISRPILTTDVAGCRDTVLPNQNGLLVPAKNSEALATAMIWFIENPNQWVAMGEKSRELVCQFFDVDKVNSNLIDIMGIPPSIDLDQ